MTFTNLSNFGGDFGNEFKKNIEKFDSLEIASGYFGVSTVEEYEKELLKIAERGCCKIIIGMIFHEGVSKSQRQSLIDLNKKLIKINEDSGIYITVKQYHGKIYKFKKNDKELIYIGSSNFSPTGFSSNIECNTLIKDSETQKKLSNFLNYLFDDREISAKLDPLKPNDDLLFLKTKKRKKYKDKLNSYEIPKQEYPTLPSTSETIIKLRVSQQPASSLNLCFEKGRLNRNTGKYSRRPWYEVEITSSSKERGKDYPIGEFTAYAKDIDINDDGSKEEKFYKLNMITASDNNKAISTKDGREILGELIKGKLEKTDCLEKHERITIDTLRSYERDYISLKKINNKDYYLVF